MGLFCLRCGSFTLLVTALPSTTAKRMKATDRIPGSRLPRRLTENRVPARYTASRSSAVMPAVFSRTLMPAAIAAGYFISESMYDISVCRQALNDPDAAVYARHQLFSRLPKTIRLINAEEDLGLEGLRILKRGMRPVSLLTMFEGVSK